MTHRHGTMVLNNPMVLIMKNIITVVLCFITLHLTTHNVAAQTQVMSGSRGTSTIISPNGITTIMPMGSRGYTVIGSKGVTSVLNTGSGGDSEALISVDGQLLLIGR